MTILYLSERALLALSEKSKTVQIESQQG